MQRVLRDLSAALGCIVALSLICLITAIAQADQSSAFGFGVTAGVCFIIAALMRALGSKNGDVGRIHAAAATLTVWVMTPGLCALAFMIAEDVSFSRAVWEATSNLSTTGLFFVAPDDRTAPMLLWRAGLHVLGCAFGIAAVSVALNAFRLSRADEPGAYFRAVVADDPLQSARRVAVSCLQILGVVVLFGAFFFGLFGASAVEAVAVASAAATSGFILPMDAEWANPFTLLLLIVLFLISASSFATHAECFRDGVRPYLDNPDSVWIVAAALGASVLVFVFADIDLFAALAGGAGMASGAWTEGVSLEASPFLLTLAGVFAFLGGSRLSSTGGVKIARVRAALRGVRVEVSRSAFRDSVAGDTTTVQETLAAWTHVFAFLVLIGVAAGALSAFGFEAPDALRLAIGATANFGPMVQDLSLYDMPDSSLGWVLSVCMVFGKLEIVLVLAATRPGFWRR